MTKNILLALGSLFFVFLVLEGITRVVIPFNPSYYMSIQHIGGCHQYAFGDICRNSDGHPDSFDFDLTDPSFRILYFGDSVCMGVGAGNGHRIQDILRAKLPEFAHWTVCESGNGLELGKVKAITKKLKPGLLIYLMNLNDILPANEFFVTTNPSTSKSKAEATRSHSTETPILWRLRQFEARYLSWVRGSSYFLTWVRSKLKGLFISLGYEAHGFRDYMLYPGEERDLAIHHTIDRIVQVNDMLEQRDISFLVAILPYEMQISSDAAFTYRNKHNIFFDDDFYYGFPQKMLEEQLPTRVPRLDLRSAFPPADQNSIGEYFVYDQGDKLDWNHPNRSGHSLISEYLNEKLQDYLLD